MEQSIREKIDAIHAMAAMPENKGKKHVPSLPGKPNNSLALGIRNGQEAALFMAELDMALAMAQQAQTITAAK